MDHDEQSWKKVMWNMCLDPHCRRAVGSSSLLGALPVWRRVRRAAVVTGVITVALRVGSHQSIYADLPAVHDDHHAKEMQPVSSILYCVA